MISIKDDNVFVGGKKAESGSIINLEMSCTSEDMITVKAEFSCPSLDISSFAHLYHCETNEMIAVLPVRLYLANPNIDSKQEDTLYIKQYPFADVLDVEFEGREKYLLKQVHYWKDK